MPSWKQDILGLNSRNMRIFSIGELLYRHANNLLEKNLSIYLPIGAWFVIRLMMWVYSKLGRQKYFSQVLSLEYIGWIGWWSLLFKSRKYFSLKLDAWKYICYILIIKSHSSLLLNSHDILLDKIGFILYCFDSCWRSSSDYWISK